MAADANNSHDSQIDYGLLVLRSVALLLVVTIGWEKMYDLANGLRAGKSLATIGLAPLINKMGFPLAAWCALYVVLNESLGALLVALGSFTRVAAACAAMSMAGAFYTALRFGWEPLRAFIFLFVFATLAVSGAGRFSFDSRFIKWRPIVSSADAGLLLLRIGILTFFVLLFTLKKGGLMGSFALGPTSILLCAAVILAVPAVIGCFTRQVSIISCALWGWAAVSGLAAGQHWDIFPYRDGLLVLLFLVLAVAGPGRYSLATLRERR